MNNYRVHKKPWYRDEKSEMSLLSRIRSNYYPQNSNNYHRNFINIQGNLDRPSSSTRRSIDKIYQPSGHSRNALCKINNIYRDHSVRFTKAQIVSNSDTIEAVGCRQYTVNIPRYGIQTYFMVGPIRAESINELHYLAYGAGNYIELDSEFYQCFDSEDDISIWGPNIFDTDIGIFISIEKSNRYFTEADLNSFMNFRISKYSVANMSDIKENITCHESTDDVEMYENDFGRSYGPSISSILKAADSHVKPMHEIMRMESWSESSEYDDMLSNELYSYQLFVVYQGESLRLLQELGARKLLN